MRPTVNSAVSLSARWRRSRSALERGMMWLRLISSPVSGSGIRQTSAAWCWRSYTSASVAAAPASLGWDATSVTRSPSTHTSRGLLSPAVNSLPVRAGIVLLSLRTQSRKVQFQRGAQRPVAFPRGNSGRPEPFQQNPEVEREQILGKPQRRNAGAQFAPLLRPLDQCSHPPEQVRHESSTSVTRIIDKRQFPHEDAGELDIAFMVPDQRGKDPQQ